MTACASVTVKPQTYLPAQYLGFDLSPIPAGRTRCKDDMLNGECAICLGHDLNVPVIE